MSVAEPRIVPADRLTDLVVRIWEGLGAPAREARLLAEHLVGANLAGHDSHGVAMLPRYVDSLRDGALVLGAHPRIVADTGVVATLDAGMGLGQVAAYEAMELGIERARRQGAAVVALRNTHHVGRIGAWAEQCAVAGFVSLHLVNVPGDDLVAPYGGTAARMGTNPFCAAFPRPGRDPILADFATSRVAVGKTRVAMAAGKELAPGTVLDAEGRPSTDPAVMWSTPRGVLVAAGEHKGSGLSILIELLAGAMCGGGVTTPESSAARRGIVNSMFSLVVDPGAFGADDAQAQADAFLSWVSQTRPAEGVDRVLLPGEYERLSRESRAATGIPIADATWEEIRGAATAAGLDAGAL